MKRRCGVLMPVASLPSPYGIGNLGKEAYRFIDFLAEAGQTYWQILPLGQTGYGDSPYQTFSAFAGNPYFIDLDALVEKGYITASRAKQDHQQDDPTSINYAHVYETRFPLLEEAYENSPLALHAADAWKGSEYDAERSDFAAFVEENRDWLPDYALYSAVKADQGSIGLLAWETAIRRREAAALADAEARLANEVRFWEVLQYWFFQEWIALKDYANAHGIRIVGDIPIYVAMDSADTWSHPELFALDEDGYPTVVAGCPPDAFSATGQLWGNPIYRWDYHKETGYAWWIRRMEMCFTLYDVVRIDHFRGFDEYYAIPAGDETAEHGTWQPGPGYDLFAAIEAALGSKEIIAEDLGFLTDSVREMVQRTGYPSMKVLQFAFDSRGKDSDYLPHNYSNNCVVYTGTHDNQTTRGWYESISEDDRALATAYCGIHSGEEATWEFIRTAMASVADTCIIPMQDYLDLGDEARINQPSTLGGNWQWRMESGALVPEFAARMRKLATVYARTEASRA